MCKISRLTNAVQSDSLKMIVRDTYIAWYDLKNSRVYSHYEVRIVSLETRWFIYKISRLDCVAWADT